MALSSRLLSKSKQLYGVQAIAQKDRVIPVRFFAKEAAPAPKGLKGDGRIFKKIELSESIRYDSGDPIESWLNGLLCLDVVNSIPKISRLPTPM